MVCKREKRVCNICVYFCDVRQFSSSQKDVQKHSLTGFDVARYATKKMLSKSVTIYLLPRVIQVFYHPFEIFLALNAPPSQILHAQKFPKA